MEPLIYQSSQNKQRGGSAQAKGQVQFPNQQESRIRENCLHTPTGQTYHLVSEHHSICPCLPKDKRTQGPELIPRHFQMGSSHDALVYSIIHSSGCGTGSGSEAGAGMIHRWLRRKDITRSLPRFICTLSVIRMLAKSSTCE